MSGWVKSGPLPSLRLGRLPLKAPKRASRACLDISVACRDRTHALQQNCAFNHLRGGSQAHYGSRVQYALRTERYACAASNNPFLDTAVNTTPTRNGLPSFGVGGSGDAFERLAPSARSALGLQRGDGYGILF